MKKKIVSIILATLLMVHVLSGCSGQNNSQKNDTSQTAYAKLMTYKTENYLQQSIADFNAVLDNDYPEFGEVYETVVKDILPDDENYDFVMLTLSASVSEIYFKNVEKSDEFGMNFCVKKQTKPIKPLPGEELIFLAQEPIYDFNFWGTCYIKYTIPNPSMLTVEERDNALRTIQTEMQEYVDGLSEDEIMSGNIRMLLTDKAIQLANNVSSDNIKLNCEIDSIEIYNEGTKISQ
ncbi:MAG: hypothetical protein K2G45_08280 [Lachnospiraceae bacterium]|nr:hypothetical protein [Lachnospiraceae bacterium]